LAKILKKTINNGTRRGFLTIAVVRRDAAYKKVTSGGLRKTGAVSLGDIVKSSVLEAWWFSKEMCYF
jgi:hypothetical protein